MNKHIFFISVILLISSTICAQTVEEIQQSDEYLWGTGNALTLKQADNDALVSLVSQISTSVSSRFEQLTESCANGDKIIANDKVKSIIQTYSRATLNNTLRIVIKNEPDAAVMRYIKKSEIERIFEGRRNKLLDFTSEAERLEKKMQVADALRYYYWAFVLLQSYPDGNFLTMKDDSGTERLLVSWIPRQMNEIFTNITLSTEAVRQENNLKIITVKVFYKGKPACNYDYSYFDGRDWSNIYSAKDGTGIIELPVMANIDNLPVKTEYMFEGESNIDNELAEVMGSVTPIVMRNSYLKLEGEKTKMENEILSAAVDEEKKNSGLHYLMLQEATPYLETMRQVEAIIRNRNYSALKNLCSERGYNMFKHLIEYGNGQIIRQPDFKFLEYNGGVTCRSLVMSFSFKNNHRTFVEDVVFRLNREGKIDELSFGLNKTAVDDIMNQTAWGDTARQVLINFLENYKTAYALKRLEYIHSIFSDDALIITGSVLKNSGYGEKQLLNKRLVRYTRQSKEEYIKKLNHIFKSNEFVNLRFADNQVRKSGVGGEIYGIQIKQDYFSSSYGDTGYLFLMVDLNNPQEPLIHVRTWQPEKDPNFGLIDLSYF
ncbi:hypothetical protein BOVA604_4270 [Bacteroides ovatus]|jgi:putative uncharacterized protein (fragment)|uniref:LPP20 family lipoprotein n=1 Tax=Bacteroides TaxID=816 RepID=UPI000E85D4B1|nr:MULTISPECIES: LPP20 family lipoprotein [Bacteroides]MCS3176289.1 LPP20 family lipoprotein [Candidatus Bacteroides intestinigallinarum]RGN59552.1 hypothetical protein DXB58_13110 [Bacteroides sp. OM05-10AA]RGQ65387.1 hypothetical protein DWY87_14215 [Bacteroides sp. AF27-33]CAG9900887.1 hypothetical protein BOVA604_4270 [Bacteroides ovatus]